jgi:hypothetical protein
MVIMNAPIFRPKDCYEYNLSDFSEGELLSEENGRETFLADAGQRPRAIISGDDPGDQQPPERHGLYPRPDAVAANASWRK